MELRIDLAGGDEIREKAALLQWLRTDRRLAGHVRLRRRPAGSEELGGALEVLMVAVGSGGVAAVLAQSLPVWLQSRRPAVKVKLTTSTGESVELETADASEAPRLIEELLRNRDDESD
ncbi:hypothetical protein [Actinomadura sp. K4S16]|uniref:effector-associated constant component EACC1 n=1 Tax=Actinomadura sp. K4S16 TaxID=1316147 RepID=UPI0011EE01D6|nr:hypothetical protein [Actinomadura sp. K4S16]